VELVSDLDKDEDVGVATSCGCPQLAGNWSFEVRAAFDGLTNDYYFQLAFRMDGDATRFACLALFCQTPDGRLWSKSENKLRCTLMDIPCNIHNVLGLRR
jgi:hypothetical protein